MSRALGLATIDLVNPRWPAMLPWRRSQAFPRLSLSKGSNTAITYSWPSMYAVYLKAS